MKKFSLFFLMALICLTGFSQRFKVITSTNFQEYKKHYSHSIEGGYVNNQSRQFVAGNVTDWGYENYEVTGHPFDGVSLLPGRKAYLNVGDERVQLTDFTIYPTDEYQYGAGTGVYYPNGTGGMGYPFFAIYDKITMAIISAEYYNLVYPGIQEPANAVGLRIKYSHVARAFYISGVIADRLFEDINMNNIRGKSKGFILKIDDTGMNLPQVLLFDPDNLPNAPDEPLLCVVTDLEFSDHESNIAFTGITTKEQLNGYHHPMTGMIDMNLNLQWCYAYEFTGNRYSGVDVEYNTTDNKLLVLHNSARYPFAVMELDYNGNITQQAVNYEFSQPLPGLLPGIARAHIMHYDNGEIMITGNCFVDGQAAEEQLLFSYEISDATNLQSGNNYYTYYSSELVPVGDQKPVTSYWTPENSIYQEGKLFITGICNNNNSTFGYTLIDVDDMINIPGCIDEEDATVSYPLNIESLECTATLSTCNKTDFSVLNLEDQPTPIIECAAGKSSPALGDKTEDFGNLWQFKGIDAQGVHAVLYAETETVYMVNIYDVMGRKVYSSSYKVAEGKTDIYLEFATKAELYFINVSNVSQNETLKVLGNW
jgi:hypothetical protein